MARRKKKQTLTTACAALLKTLEKDLHVAVGEDADRKAQLKAEWSAAKEAGRTAKTFNAWTEELLTQVGASWILACVFVRFAEDNGLIDRPLLSGPVEGSDGGSSPLQRARDAEAAYYREHPTHAEVEYLEHVFRKLAALPGMADLFDQRHAALWRMRPRPEGGRALVEFFRGLEDETGQLRWDFNDHERDTRFMGDLYQDLSESARKNFALLQTPDFVEAFILDRTLEPALDTFGLEGFRMIDPTCGSGHFLLGAFDRILARWREEEPGSEVRELVRRSLDAVHGVDVNPFAVAIARFRLLVAALRACGIARLAGAPDFHLHLAVGDSLLHGPRFNELRGRQQDMYEEYDLGHIYSLELPDDLRAILGQQYHAVVGNPPYITPKDKALNEAYRQKYGSCSGKYALSVPFLERFVELAIEGRLSKPAGYVGNITSNSFMKREFGKKVIEEYFPRWDLTHVIDTSDAHIPGHGTPTVLLFLRNQTKGSDLVRAVLRIRGESSTPDDPGHGLVWSAIMAQIDTPGSESEYVSVEDVDRTNFHSHPWSLGGGGASELKELIESRAHRRLGEIADSIGVVVVTLEDDVFNVGEGVAERRAIPKEYMQGFVEGDRIRDWALTNASTALWPYDDEREARLDPAMSRALWPYRMGLLNRLMFGKRQYERGKAWFEYGMVTKDKFRTPLSIAFAEIATHNHFVLDRGGKVFSQTAPVIKLHPDATEDDHWRLLWWLNSSLFLFWARQACHNKGGGGIGGGLATEAWEKFVVFNATSIASAPVIPPASPVRAKELSVQGARFSVSPMVVGPDAQQVGLQTWHAELTRAVAAQEALDWEVYVAAGLCEGSLIAPEEPPLRPGQRAFELVLADRVRSGEVETAWFERNSAEVTTELPSGWPDSYCEVVRRRIQLIRTDRFIGLLEQPEHKRRWNVESYAQRMGRSTQDALLAMIEAVVFGGATSAAPLTVHQLSEALTASTRISGLMPAVEGMTASEAESLLLSLVERQAVPHLPREHLSQSGLRKFREWEESWRLQRIEDPLLERQHNLLTDHFGSSAADQRRAREHVACWMTADKLSKEKGLTEKEEAALAELRARWMHVDAERRSAIGGETPPVPPKYKPTDFQSQRYWALRGKLDVPKERFISYPNCSPDGDDSLLIGWAGWDHAQRAGALAKILGARKSEGWSGERLLPILLGIDELILWLKQWHGDLGAEYQGYLESECAAAGVTLEQVRAWTPPTKKRGKRKAKA